MQFIRSLVFNIFLYIGIVLVFVLAIPTLILPPKFTLYCGKFLAYYIVLILKLFLNTKVVFHGLENLKKVEKFFIASAHQSMFETFVLQIPLNFPIFILSKKFKFCFVVVSLIISIDPIFFKYHPNNGIFRSSFFKIKTGKSSGA